MKKNSEYSKKLRDPRWQKKRLEVMEKAQWSCEACGDSGSELQVHHGLYEFGKEPWEHADRHLWCICKNCHEEATSYKKHISKAVGCINPRFYPMIFSLVSLHGITSRAHKDVGEMGVNEVFQFIKLFNETEKFIACWQPAVLELAEKLYGKAPK